MKFFYVIFCFLIFSCDLPDETNLDCNGDSEGTAFIDDCGVCVEGNTGLVANSNKTECGDGGPDSCYNYSCYEEQCNDLEAINYHEVSNENLIDNGLCIYDICTDYITSNQIDCDSSLTVPYELDQNLGCDAANAQLSMCYPEDCDTEFSLSDFEGKIIWIIYEADW